MKERIGVGPFWIAAVAVVVASLALIVVVVTLVREEQPRTPTSESVVGTSALGCPVRFLPSPSDPNRLSAAGGCTRTALIRRVCLLDVNRMVQAPNSGDGAIRWSDAAGNSVSWQTSGDGPVAFECRKEAVPSANAQPFEARSLSVTRAEWETLLKVGPLDSSLAAKIDSAAASGPVEDDPASGDCSENAIEALRQVVVGSSDFAEVREQGLLPARVSEDVLSRYVRGVRNYQSDGLSLDEAVTESGGALSAGFCL